MSEYVSFSSLIICSDTFCCLPASARVLYFHLCINADNNGIVNNAKATARSIDVSFSEMSCLVDSGYVNELKDGCYKIVHHIEHNGRGESHKKRLTYNYRKWRKNVIDRDGWKCLSCGEKTNLVAHHIVPFSECAELQTVISNGITLCDRCHKMIHKGVLECPTLNG